MNNKKCHVVTFGNFKGGTGKTTNSTMMAYSLAKMGYKVLLSDQDPQANATSLYLRTKANHSDDIVTFDKTLMTAIQDQDLSPIITEVRENLYLLPSFSDFAQYPKFLERSFSQESDRVKYFSTLLEPIKSEFDFIFIDVPPTISIITDSALYASDWVVVVLQTHERSLQGAEVFTNYLQSLIDDYGADMDILGILPVLLKNNAPVDNATLDSAKEIFGEHNLFENLIKNMERLKRYDVTGIKEEDMHDRRVFKRYHATANEFLQRIEKANKEE
ncbi:Cellulose biosynthesis protein BcsQ [Pelagirhabdus alkalitolerans]|uniref:Cellulose biosynthesis protein BcsQ n=1 Tax=Pelagirhabdus alkalitolerans TaxID=1612202 RepID=A0A1G6N009_9BACI|nr:AAA family ATPase [Pelagirhabdus alkalitolerans]SDC61169.1 Cellulose biosynthesis protein BcsQ [Pelagirhabdus alkalitolerans]